MTRKLATIQKIANLEAIPNADAIEVAQILGWKCVVKKDEYKVGDLVVYFEVDSFIPVKPELEFLRKGCYKKLPDGTEGFRIRTIRLRGQISQGLVMPLSLLGKLQVEEGTEVAEYLKVIKYEPPIPACIAGEVKGYFPAFMPKTDETRVQLLQNVISRYVGTKCYVTEKIDGASATYYLKDGEFGVCSRNLDLKETSDNAFWQFAREANIEEKLRRLSDLSEREYSMNHQLKNVAIQGELFGNGIQGNPLKQNTRKVMFFQVFDIDKYCYLDFGNFVHAMGLLGLESVPILDTNFSLVDNIDELVKLSVAKSKINPKLWREGIVIRPLKETLDMGMGVGIGIGGSGRLSFKVVNPEYLLVNDA